MCYGKSFHHPVLGAFSEASSLPNTFFSQGSEQWVSKVSASWRTWHSYKNSSSLAPHPDIPFSSFKVNQKSSFLSNQIILNWWLPLCTLRNFRLDTQIPHFASWGFSSSSLLAALNSLPGSPPGQVHNLVRWSQWEKREEGNRKQEPWGSRLALRCNCMSTISS